MQQFLARRWFLLVLVAVLSLGFGGHHWLQAPAQFAPKNAIVALVLFFMSLPLDARAMWRALRHPGPAILATGLNMIVVPLLAWLISPLLVPELGIGLLIMAAIPCTLASAAVWTRRAGGNDAVSLMVTMTTNLSCFLVTPTWLRLLTKTEATLDFNQMMRQLLSFVVLPILIAQLFRLRSSIANWATARKVGLSILSQCGILSIVLLGAINGGARLASGDNASIGWLDWGLMLLAVNVVHATALGLAHLFAMLCRLERADRIAVGFAGSQKTLAIGLAIGPQFFGGLTIMPMIAYHVCQLLFDTLVVDYLRSREAKVSDEIDAQTRS
jgi:sodium/bile acid cotransporter 7